MINILTKLMSATFVVKKYIDKDIRERDSVIVI